MKGKRLHPPVPPQRRRESGFVLVTALMFLIVLTVLGLSIMSTNTLEERMAGYFRDRQLALESAEAGLRDAERDIFSGSRAISGIMGFEAGCADSGSYQGLCQPNTSVNPIWVDLETPSNAGYPGWVGSGSENAAVKSVKYGTFSNAPLLARVARQPRYIIEAVTVPSFDLEPGKSSYVYRVSAVGFGRRVATRVVLQALYLP